MKNIFILVFTIVAFNACTSEIPFNPKDSEVRVVNCILTSDTIQTLSITQSVVINGSYLFKEIRDAKAELYYSDSMKIGDFERLGYDDWELNYQPEINKKYTLKVTLPDGQILSATTTMPVPNKFEYISTDEVNTSINVSSTYANSLIAFLSIISIFKAGFCGVRL